MSARDVQTEFAKWGEVRMPHDAEAPILGPALRQTLHQWMHELNFARELNKVGVQPRRRAMLKGPPGTGKTTLAWHVAARLGLPLVVVETPSLISSYIGRTGEQIGELFRRARTHGDGVALFFDELDAVAHKRGDGGTSAGTEKNNIVIALLQMMDRHKGLLFAATNKPGNIDPAIWRRFQMQIEVGLPAEAERFAIVKHYIAPFTLPDETVKALAEAFAGAAPALMREALECVKRDLVLGPKLGHELNAEAVFSRIVASTGPAPDMPTPPLWNADQRAEVLEELARAPWPPQLEA